jgi:hypothetical protein
VRISYFFIPATMAGLVLLTPIPTIADSQVRQNSSQSPTSPYIVGGADAGGNTLYVCLLYYTATTVQPGKVTTDSTGTGCNISYAGKEIRSVVPGSNIGDWAYLTMYSQGGYTGYAYLLPALTPPQIGPQPYRPAVRDADGSAIYLCNVQYIDTYGRTSTQPGKAILNNNQWSCRFGYNGNEVTVTNQFKYLWFY